MRLSPHKQYFSYVIDKPFKDIFLCLTLPKMAYLLFSFFYICMYKLSHVAPTLLNASLNISMFITPEGKTGLIVVSHVSQHINLY